MSNSLAGDHYDTVVFGAPNGRLSMQFDLATLSTTHFDDPWPTATVEFGSPGLHATLRATFFPGSLQEFTKELSSIHQALKGEAAIEDEEGRFSLTVEYAKAGEVTLTGSFRPKFESSSVLNYQLETDQSYLGIALRGLQALLS